MSFHPRRLAFLLPTIAFVVVVDRLTKWWAMNTLVHKFPRNYWGDFLRIGYTENTGVFLGLGDSLPAAVRFTLFVVLVGITLLFVAYYLVTAPHLGKWRITCLTMILAGGIGNLIDRVAYNGVVVDFLNIGIGGLRTGVFNVADMAVTGGVIALAVTGAWGDRSRREGAPGTGAEPPEPVPSGDGLQE